MHEDSFIKQSAEELAHKEGKRIALQVADITIYNPDELPVSIFMGGSPGAGKTEFSKAFIHLGGDDPLQKIVRIDGDEFRGRLPGYTGTNSFLFQGAISILVEKVHDLVLKRKQSFLLDGTFSNYTKAVQNIDRSLSKGRQVYVMYVYQRPEVAWNFTQSREVTEGRNIQKEAFIREFLASRETVKQIIARYGTSVSVFLIRKNFENDNVENVQTIRTPEMIDECLGHTYTKEELEHLL